MSRRVLQFAAALLLLTLACTNAAPPSSWTATTHQGNEMPNATFTPGDILTGDAPTICKPGYAATVRSVSTATKRAVTEEYGFHYPVARDHEIDHLISLELGGSNDIKNLWLQFGDVSHNYHQKDTLENKMHTLVCHGQLALPTAQSEIRTNWMVAYTKYIGAF